MADAKAVEKEEAALPVSLLNKSGRKFVVTKDGKPFTHEPGKIVTYSAAEAAKLAGYKELLDTSKIPGALDAAKLKKENADLLAANKALQAQLDALKPSPAPAPAPSEKPKK